MRTLDLRISKEWRLELVALEAAQMSTPGVDVALVHPGRHGDRTEMLLKFEGILDLMKFANLFRVAPGDTRTEQFSKKAVVSQAPPIAGLIITTGNTGVIGHSEWVFTRPHVDSRDSSYSDTGWTFTTTFDLTSREAIVQYLDDVLQQMVQV